MGNEGSKLKGLVIDKNAVEANDFFSLHDGETTLTTPSTRSEEGRIEKLSVFQGARTGGQQLWGTQGAIKHAIKNLMIYRHPYILKYITTWEKSGEIYLATERVRPLNSVLDTLNDIQICLGLRTILCGLIFLTEKAMARHLNLCTTSIFVTENGSWRLAGFEYVWKSSEVKKSLLELLETYRYKPAVDPDELKTSENMNTIEQYSFATLCIEILNRSIEKAAASHRNDCETPHAIEFREYCSSVLRTKKPEMRPKLAAILLHPYFNHEFVLIHSFLFELPLKSLSEKQSFFTSLVDRLRYFNENVVAAQLTTNLLSRMVLLDPTAQLCVTPYVLKTKSVENSAALFNCETYQEHVMPHIKRMFRLRDAQIRLILLEYFMEYVRLLTEEELKEFILPHLLVGMNDSNDVLVAKTLRCLADLIPVLGAGAVLGERMRLFADGRPQAAVTAESVKHWVEPRSITPVLTSGKIGQISSDDDGVDFMVSASPIPGNIEINGSCISLAQSELINIVNGEQHITTEMPPRLSPDGGEDDKSVVTADGISSISNETPLKSFDNEKEPYSCIENHISINENIIETAKDMNGIQSETEDPWSDWEAEEEIQLKTSENTFKVSSESIKITMKNVSLNASSATNANTKRFGSKQINDDLSTFDIQVQKTATPPNEKQNEFDFFKDMEPVIKPTNNIGSLSSISSSRQQSSTALNVIDRTDDDHDDDDEEVLIDSSRFAAMTQYVDSTGTEKVVIEQSTFDIGTGWDVEDDDDTACLKNDQ